MNAIALIDKLGGLGSNGKLLYSVPSDMRFFKEMTTGKVIVVGKKTFLGFPGSEPLPNRTNIVLTSDKTFSKPGVEVAHDMVELESILSRYNGDDIFIAGGRTVYEKLIDKCDKLYINRIVASDYDEDEIDTFFPTYYIGAYTDRRNRMSDQLRYIETKKFHHAGEPARDWIIIGKKVDVVDYTVLKTGEKKKATLEYFTFGKIDLLADGLKEGLKPGLRPAT